MTIASWTCCGAGAAESSTPMWSASISNHPDLADEARGGVPFHHVPVAEEDKGEAEERMLDSCGQGRPGRARALHADPQRRSSSIGWAACDQHPPLVLACLRGRQPLSSCARTRVKLIGATAHYVTAELDGGPIIEQDVPASITPERRRAGTDRPRHRAAGALACRSLHLEDRVIAGRGAHDRDFEGRRGTPSARGRLHGCPVNVYAVRELPS